MPAQIACWGNILSSVKPGTVLISKKYSSWSTKINSDLEKPERDKILYTFSATNSICSWSSKEIIAGVISSDFPSYFAS